MDTEYDNQCYNWKSRIANRASPNIIRNVIDIASGASEENYLHYEEIANF